MNTKIVYTLTSDYDDLYLEQFRISFFSLRVFNPDVYVQVVVDTNTYDTFCANRSILGDNIDVIVVDVPLEYTKVQRSRFLKTNLRNLISGDYLFIDTDTVINGTLDGIDSCQADVAAVLDTMCPHVNAEYCYGHFLTEVQKLNWDWNIISGAPYYNSGVMYVRDTPASRELYRHWNRRWIEHLGIGEHKDQLPLCQAIIDTGISIHDLPYEWNFQIKVVNEFQPSRIIHYFASGHINQQYYLIESNWVLEEIKATGNIPLSVKNKLTKPSEIFQHRQIVISEEQLSFLNGPIYGFSKSQPRFYVFLLKIISYYSLFSNLLSKAKATLFMSFVHFQGQKES